MARRTLLDEATRGAGRFTKRTGKALRSGMKVRKKKGGKKRAKRNERQIALLAQQVETLTRQLSAKSAGDDRRHDG
jgi:hypothetical protein